MKSNKFRLGLALLFPLFLVSCVTNPEGPSTPEENSSQTSGKPTESSPSDDRGTISGPGTTEEPNDDRTDDPNNPYHKPDVYPSDIADEVAPKDYNLYFYSAVDATKRDSVWMWGTTYNSIGLIPTNTNLTLEGVDSQYKFSALYMTYDKFYTCYNAWDFSTEGFFAVSKDDTILGLQMRASSKGADEENYAKTIDIDLSSVTINQGGPTNIYIVEKSANVIQVFTSTDGVNDYLNKKEDLPIWTLEETKASDFNIYTYCPWGNEYRDSLYVWGGTFKAGVDLPLIDSSHPSKEIPLVKNSQGNDVLFNALYFTYGKQYKAYNGWGSKDETIITIDESNYFSSAILKVNGGDQTLDLTIPALKDIVADSDGHKNVYIIETDKKENNKAKAEVFTSLADVQNYFSAKSK